MMNPNLVGIVVCHPKDFETLGPCLESMRNHCRGLGEVVVVSPSAPSFDLLKASATEMLGPARWMDESLFPFHLSDFEGCRSPSPGWLLQQMIKFYTPKIMEKYNVFTTTPQASGKPLQSESQFYLICDADVIWINDVDFIGQSCNGEPAALLNTFDAGDVPKGNRSHADLARYDDFVEAILPGLAKRRRCVETAVVHHAVFDHVILEDLFARVEGSAHGASSAAVPREFWQIVRDLARMPVEAESAEITSQEFARGLAVSEYELYFAFSWKFHNCRIIPRPLAFAIARDWRSWTNPSKLQCPDDPNAQTAVSYVVSHSHLRSNMSMDEKSISSREGVINSKCCQSTPPAARAVEARIDGGSKAERLTDLKMILMKNGAFDSPF